MGPGFGPAPSSPGGLVQSAPRQKQVMPPKDEDIPPVDSREALVKAGLDLRSYGCCTERIEVPGKGIMELGCRAFDLCTRATKGKGRPVNGGVSIVKPGEMGGGSRDVIMTCHEYFLAQPQTEARGMVLDWYAEEGQEVLLAGSKPDRVDAEGKPIPGTTYSDTTFPTKVPEFKTITQNPKLVRAAYQAEVMKRNRERLVAERRAAVFGVPTDTNPTETPEGTDEPGATQPARRPQRR